MHIVYGKSASAWLKMGISEIHIWAIYVHGGVNIGYNEVSAWMCSIMDQICIWARILASAALATVDWFCSWNGPKIVHRAYRFVQFV